MSGAAVLVSNIHERTLPAAMSQAAPLLDQLASENDLVWPYENWPAIRFDRPLSVGAAGGHGPVLYFIEAYNPGKFIRFRFTAPRGFIGTHEFELAPAGDDKITLRHSLVMRAEGPALLSWPLIFRPLHDALVEDALDRAERHMGLTPKPARWSLYVRFLRKVLVLLSRLQSTNSSLR